MFNFFSISNENTSFLGQKTGIKAPKAIKSGDGVIDVYQNFRWRLAKDVSEVPSITLREMEINFGAWVQNFFKIINAVSSVVNGKFDDPYAGMYVADPTEFVYHLPHLIPEGAPLRGDIANSYTKDSNILESIPGFDFIQNVFKKVLPGVGMEEIQKFASTNTRSLTISFPLYNTFDLKSANDNFSFVSLLQFQNLKTRTSLMTYNPPKIYQVSSDSDGGIYMPVAWISSLKVESIGTTRKMTDFGRTNAWAEGSGSGYRLVPEAYKVNITLTELIPQSANIMASELGDSKINASLTTKQFLEQGNQIVEGAGNNLKSVQEKTKSASNAINNLKAPLTP